MDISPTDALSVLRAHLESLVSQARAAAPNPPPNRILDSPRALEWQEVQGTDRDQVIAEYVRLQGLADTEAMTA